MILASAGITRFCLDTMDTQFDKAYQSLLDCNIYKLKHTLLTWETVDEQLQRCNASVCGYFSPKQRKLKFEQHLQILTKQFQQQQEDMDDGTKEG
jgi:hypothetical protein